VPLSGSESLEVKAAIDDEVEEAQALIEGHIEYKSPPQDRQELFQPRSLAPCLRNRFVVYALCSCYGVPVVRDLICVTVLVET
jgi:hypothetical protein